MIKPLIFISLVFSLISCTAKRFNTAKFDYIKLKDYKYTAGELKVGSELELLSVSGGEHCSNTDLFLYQFVGIEKETGDTVRILSPCQVYDEVKAQRICFYQPLGFSVAELGNFMSEGDKKNEVSADHIFVVINKTHFTETADYKTVFGAVGFKD